MTTNNWQIANNVKPSHFMAGLAWLNVFALVWCWLLDFISIDLGSIGAFIFFVLIALFASAFSVNR